MIFFTRIAFAISLGTILSINISMAKQKNISPKEKQTWSIEKLEDHQKTLKNENIFYGLGEILKKAHELKNWDKVAHYVPLYLGEAEKYKEDWNYGNAIFYSNMALSEMAYTKGDKKLAREFLIKASETPGSPQLNSFGPFNNLIRSYLQKLAANGEKDSLIHFANNCKNFVSWNGNKKFTEYKENTDKKVIEGNLSALERFIDQVKTGKRLISKLLEFKIHLTFT